MRLEDTRESGEYGGGRLGDYDTRETKEKWIPYERIKRLWTPAN